MITLEYIIVDEYSEQKGQYTISTHKSFRQKIEIDPKKDIIPKVGEFVEFVDIAMHKQFKIFKIVSKLVKNKIYTIEIYAV